MITRHMRTHARYEAQRAAAAAAVAATSNGTSIGLDSTSAVAANFQRNLIGTNLIMLHIIIYYAHEQNRERKKDQHKHGS